MQEGILISIGEYIHELRESAGLDLRTLGRKTTVNPSTIQKIESGATTNPSLDTLLKMSFVLSINPRKLYSVLTGYEPLSSIFSITSEHYLDQTLANDFKIKFASYPNSGCETLSRWLNTIESYKNNEPSSIPRIIEGEESFSPFLVRRLITTNDLFSFSINYPNIANPKMIFETFKNGGLIISEDMLTYAILKRDIKEQGMDDKQFLTATNFLNKSISSDLISQLNLRDVMEIDTTFSDQGEIFMMGWQLAEMELTSNYLREFQLKKLLVLMSRWIDFLDLDRKAWLADIRDYSKSFDVFKR